VLAVVDFRGRFNSSTVIHGYLFVSLHLLALIHSSFEFPGSNFDVSLDVREG
jgi:hypothetical protein